MKPSAAGLILSALCFLCLQQNFSHARRRQSHKDLLTKIEEQKTDYFQIHSILSELHRRQPLFLTSFLRENMEQMAKYYHGHAIQAACERYGEIPEKADVMHFDMYHARKIEGVLASHVRKIKEETKRGEVQTVVVADGEDTLDVGDLGTWSAGLAMSRGILHAAMAGFHPKAVLCIVLDSGTDNEKMRVNPNYRGNAHRRRRGDEVAFLWDELLRSLRMLTPHVLIHIDCPNPGDRISKVIDDHSKVSPIFNDGLDGRATIVLSAVLAMTRVRSDDTKDFHMDQVWKPPVPMIMKEVFLLYGPRYLIESIANLLVSTLEDIGVPTPIAIKDIWLMDPKMGLYSLEDRHHHRSRFRKPLPSKLRGLHLNVSAVVEGIRATILVGASGIRGAFDRDVLKLLHNNHQRPGIIILSNTPGRAECSPADTWHHTTGNGKTLYVGGDDPQPYRPVGHDGLALIPSRASSLFVFPGFSLATYAAGISSITPGMLQAAAETLARMASIDDITCGSLFPSLSLLKDISIRIAAEIIRVAERQKKTNKIVPEGYRELLSHLQSLQDLSPDDDLHFSYSWEEAGKQEVKIATEEVSLAESGSLTRRLEL